MYSKKESPNLDMKQAKQKSIFEKERENIKKFLEEAMNSQNRKQGVNGIFEREKKILFYFFKIYFC